MIEQIANEEEEEDTAEEITAEEADSFLSRFGVEPASGSDVSVQVIIPAEVEPAQPAFETQSN